MNRFEFYSNVEKFKNNQSSDELSHYGIIGQKWGTRRWQNADGTFNDEGKIRYFGKKTEKNPNGTVFISGSSKTQFDDSPYYRKELPKAIQNQIKRYMNQGKTILVGDAPGIDRQVQDYLNQNGYNNVEIYSPGKEVRYNANPKWKTNLVDVPDAEEGSGEWLAGKDKAMTDRADEGLAIVLDNGALATRNNISRLEEQSKNCDVFQLNEDGNDGWNKEEINKRIKNNGWNEEEIVPHPSYSDKKETIYTKDIDNDEYNGKKFTIYKDHIIRKDISPKQVEEDSKIDLDFLNKKGSYDKILNALADDQYKYYKEVMKREGEKPLSKSEFIKNEDLQISEIGIDYYWTQDGNIAIDFSPGENSTWFGYEFEVQFDPKTEKITDLYQS